MADDLPPLKKERKEPSKLTIHCADCDTNLWLIDRKALKLRNAPDVFGPEQLEQHPDLKIKMKRNVSAVPMDCPVCGMDVFNRLYRGGYTVMTREKGEVPHVAGSEPGLRIRRPLRLDPSGKGRERYLQQAGYTAGGNSG